MWINKLKLHDYRAFQEECTMNLGKNITVIAGMNGVGKSTILAVLTNAGELKKYKTLNGNAFRGDFSDVIMYDENFDTTGEKATIFFSDLPKNTAKYNVIPKIDFRASKHKAQRKEVTYKKIKGTDTYVKDTKSTNYTRYRLTPVKDEKNRTSVGKVMWPSLYLGLSRLAPLGEYNSANTKNISDDISKEILKVHASILSENFEMDTAKMLNVDVGTKHTKATINSENYGYASNSNGQDNTGQIIESVLSFKILKEKLDSEYIGGILAIDELDASLHPAAQNKLFDWLLNESKQLDLQIVFTTHSLTLLEHISKLYKKEKGVIINYLHCFKPGLVKVQENPVRDFYRNNLQETYFKFSHESQYVSVFSEDEITRMFLEKILKVENMKETRAQMKFFNFNMSWTNLISLVNEDPETFESHLFILDPDLNLNNENSGLINYLKNHDIVNFKINNPKSNVFILPGNKPIEEMLWSYVNSIDGDHPLFDDPYLMNSGLTPQIIKNWNNGKENDNNFYKHWFSELKSTTNYIDYFMKYWILDNQSEVKKFCSILEKSCKRITNRLGNNN